MHLNIYRVLGYYGVLYFAHTWMTNPYPSCMLPFPVPKCNTVKSHRLMKLTLMFSAFRRWWCPVPEKCFVIKIWISDEPVWLTSFSSQCSHVHIMQKNQWKVCSKTSKLISPIRNDALETKRMNQFCQAYLTEICCGSRGLTIALLACCISAKNVQHAPTLTIFLTVPFLFIITVIIVFRWFAFTSVHPAC